MISLCLPELCDPVSMRMHAWHLLICPLAVTSAVCISVFGCVVVLVKVVMVEVTFMLFVGLFISHIFCLNLD